MSTCRNSDRADGILFRQSVLDISLLAFFCHGGWGACLSTYSIATHTMSQAVVQPFTGGDDLDDGLDVAPEYIQATTHDGDVDIDIHHSDAEADPNGFFSEDEDDVRADDGSPDEEREDDTGAQVGQKRKATTGEKDQSEGNGTPLTDLEKKKKRKVKAKERSEKVGKDTHQGL